MCAIFAGKIFLVGRVEASRVGRWCSVRKGGCPGVFILLFLIRWSHTAIYFSVFPMWKWRVNDKTLMSCTVKMIFHKGSFYYT